MTKRKCPFYDDTDAIIGTRAASSLVILLKSSRTTSPVALLGLSFREHCETRYTYEHSINTSKSITTANILDEVYSVPGELLSPGNATSIGALAYVQRIQSSSYLVELE